ncbi:MAG: molecular chaperone DnaJ [Dehalococcoidia bacterium]
MAKQDYYGVLGVPKGSSEEEIRKSFRKKALEFHPDRNKDPKAEGKFKEVNEAYQILIDPEKRARYDRFGHAGMGPQAGFARDFDGFDIFGGLGDIFDSFFGDFSTQGRRAVYRGGDLHQKVVLSFEEAYFGAEKELILNRTEQCHNCKGTRSEPGTTSARCSTCRGNGQVRRSQRGLFGQFVQVVACPTCKGEGLIINNPCSNCRGSGTERRKTRRTVNVPAGIEDGMQVRLTGEGEAGVNGGPPGNLYVGISVSPHPIFRRDGANLLLDLPLNFVQAVLGTEVKIPIIGGSESLKVPAGTQPGSVFRIRGKGMPHIRNHRRGDILIQVTLEVPTKLEPEQRMALEDLARAMSWNNDQDAGDKGLFDKLKDAFSGT